MPTHVEPIRNLLLDLGGVLYDIAPERTLAALAAFRGSGPLKTPAEFYGWEGSKLLESGALSPSEFRERARADFGLLVSDDALDQAWNALLLGPSRHSAETMQALSNHYPLALLSNTNAIHFAHFAPQCKDLFQPFQRLFLSYEMGLRKPDPAIYLTALAELGWKPGETLFVDDNADNILAAQALGMQTRLFTGPDLWAELRPG